jgi:hypothetical protein
MKKTIVTLAAAFASFSAIAAPAMTLPGGPIYLEYTGQEQIAINGAHTYTDGKEINWGVFVITALSAGNVATPNSLITKDTEEAAFFSNVASGGQITGMFYGVQQGEQSASNPFPATGGYLDIYWRDSSVAGFQAVGGKNNPSTPALRTDYSHAKGYTDGVLLAHLRFDSGKDKTSKVNTIVGTQAPTDSTFDGMASSYLSVDMSVKGLWSDALNGNWFTTKEGMRDLRLDNQYTYNANWNGNNGNILGAQLGSGSGQAYALPEPGALSLMGLALIGMGAILRRRRG